MRDCFCFSSVIRIFNKDFYSCSEISNGVFLRDEKNSPDLKKFLYTSKKICGDIEIIFNDSTEDEITLKNTAILNNKFVKCLNSSNNFTRSIIEDVKLMDADQLLVIELYLDNLESIGLILSMGIRVEDKKEELRKKKGALEDLVLKLETFIDILK